MPLPRAKKKSMWEGHLERERNTTRGDSSPRGGKKRRCGQITKLVIRQQWKSFGNSRRKGGPLHKRIITVFPGEKEKKENRSPIEPGSAWEKGCGGGFVKRNPPGEKGKKRVGHDTTSKPA